MKSKPHIYVNNQKSAAMIHAVEFAAASNEQLTFYKISSLSNAEEAKQWLLSKGLAEGFLGETELNNDTTLVVRTPLSRQAQLEMLKSEGVSLTTPTKEEKRFSLWGMRGGLSMVGQSLQLASAYLKPGGIDGPTATFAISNILANLSNMVFGSQKVSDPHRLTYIKANINQDLSEHFGVNDLPDITDVRSKSRPQAPKTLFNTMQKYSVSVGEVGLRMFGAYAMLFPLQNLKGAIQELGKGNLKGAWQQSNNFKYDGIRKSKADNASATVGLFYLIGKTIALFSKIPDPYNPKPQSTLDKWREKVFFKASSLIELGAAGYLSYDRYKNKKVNLNKIGAGDKEIPDYFGAAGGALFTVGLGIRYFAPFGERQVDMNELKAHISDALVKVPEDKRAAAMVKIIGDVVDHFGENKVSFGKLYADIATDMQKQHGLTLPALPSEKPFASISPQTDQPQKTFASDKLKKSETLHTQKPAASHQERAAESFAASDMSVAFN